VVNDRLHGFLSMQRMVRRSVRFGINAHE
jgi:hypothetical protein